MGESQPALEVSPLERAVNQAERRLRVNDAARRLAIALPFPLGVGVVALACARLGLAGEARWLLFAGLALLVASAVWVVARWWGRGQPTRGALRLDRHHGSADRVTNALFFSRLPAQERSALMNVAIRDALAAVPRPDARGAVPLRVPALLGVSAGLIVLLAGVDRLSPLTRAASVAPAVAAAVVPLELTADDVSLVREVAAQFDVRGEDAELDRAVSSFNELVEDLAKGEVDRRSAFRRLGELERSLSTDDGARDEALAAIARALSGSALSKPVADALSSGDLTAAEQALRDLAARLRREKGVRDADRARLQKALAKASEASAGRVARLDAQRQALARERKRLLRKRGGETKEPPDGTKPSEPPERSRRRLERLERELSQARQGRQSTSPLDRDLAQAARDLMRELGDSARHLDSGAQQLNRMARQQMTRAEKRRLKEQLERLRDLLRQGGPERKDHLERLRRFAQRARGGRGSRAGKPGATAEKASPGSGAKGGRGKGSRGSARLSVPVPVPGSARGAGRAGLPGDSPSGGAEGGRGSGGPVAGKATDLEVDARDVSAAAVDTGQGVSSSEVVYGAAERGFTAPSYQKLYAQYQTVAEEVLERDTIPAGYEFYVRRYFQLIRPRGDR